MYAQSLSGNVLGREESWIMQWEKVGSCALIQYQSLSLPHGKLDDWIAHLSCPDLGLGPCILDQSLYVGCSGEGHVLSQGDTLQVPEGAWALKP